MKAVITDKTSKLKTFEPVNGTYDLNKTSREMDEISAADVEEMIADDISKKHGLPVKVQIFRADGHAIVDDVPSAGSFLATRS